MVRANFSLAKWSFVGSRKPARIVRLISGGPENQRGLCGSFPGVPKTSAGSAARFRGVTKASAESAARFRGVTKAARHVRRAVADLTEAWAISVHIGCD